MINEMRKPAGFVDPPWWLGPPPSPEALARRDAARARVLQEPLAPGRRPAPELSTGRQLGGGKSPAVAAALPPRPRARGAGSSHKGIPLGRRDTTLTTEQLAAALDRLGIPPATSSRKSSAALRAAGIRHRSIALRPAIQLRRNR